VIWPVITSGHPSTLLWQPQHPSMQTFQFLEFASLSPIMRPPQSCFLCPPCSPYLLQLRPHLRGERPLDQVSLLGSICALFWQHCLSLFFLCVCVCVCVCVCSIHPSSECYVSSSYLSGPIPGAGDRAMSKKSSSILAGPTGSWHIRRLPQESRSFKSIASQTHSTTKIESVIQPLGSSEPCHQT
jgi:hypothetical protein